MKLPLNENLRERLRQIREAQWADMLDGHPQMVDEVFLERDVVRLKSGGGSSAYLALDGAVIVCHFEDGFQPGVLRNPREVASVLIRWARDIGMPELVDLLPARPENGEICLLCKGSRYMPLEVLAGANGERLYCRRCGGLGWTVSQIS